MKNLQDFPRICLAALPTPIQKLENISRLLGTNIYIKRDDLTGIGLGGNKVRKLEFLLADAKRKGAEIVFTTGGAQSNHAMLTAACAKKLGMTPILILKKRGVTERKGNQLLEYLMDTDVRFVDTYSCVAATEDRARIMEFFMTHDDEAELLIQSPYIRAKLQIMCDAVRRYFDTAGWGTPRWERPLTQLDNAA